MRFSFSLAHVIELGICSCAIALVHLIKEDVSSRPRFTVMSTNGAHTHMQLAIIQEPDARLHEVAEEVCFGAALSFAVRESVNDLSDTFHAADNCIGLAAPQLGIPLRIIIVDVTDRRTDTYIMINPVITKESEDQQLVQDGCMSVSFGKKHLQTRRPKRIVVTWVNMHGLICKQKFSGTIAACIHHEIDHLNGMLFMDRYLRIDHAVL